MGIGELPAQVDRVGGHSLGGGEVGPRVHEVAGQARAVGEADGLTEGRLRGGYSSGRRVVGGAANYKPAVTPQNESSVPQTGSGKALPPVSPVTHLNMWSPPGSGAGRVGVVHWLTVTRGWWLHFLTVRFFKKKMLSQHIQ